jgi:hypothetical protein
MFSRFTKKRLAVGLGVVGALALAAGAYAYFTSTGTGTSTATAGAPSQYTVTVTPGSPVSLTPQTSSDVSGSGGIFQSYTGTVKNNSSGRQDVTGLKAQITGVTGGSNTPNACTTGDFSLYSPGGNWSVAADGQSATTTNGGTGASLPSDMQGGATLSYNDIAVYMVDKASNQNGCQGATVNLSVTAS